MENDLTHEAWSMKKQANSYPEKIFEKLFFGCPHRSDST